MALPTNGRVIIDTTAGEIEIELWAKETPKTCRNFLALAMEGYYDGVIFHRVVPNFLIQTGDRTGTGAGGESFYGDQFEDEIHPRLRFAHRGLVAMANNGTKNSNDSQFIITLDRADELHGKHTLFGRCIGDTVYNVMKIGETEIDENERPVYPPKIKGVRILENPFDDIVPRITAAEKRAQQRAKESSQREREEMERRKGAKKNVKLLSFDDDAAEESEPVVFTKKAIVRPDLIDDLEPAMRIPDFVANPKKGVVDKPKADKDKDKVQGTEKDKDSKKKNDVAVDINDLSKIREQHAKSQTSEQRARQTEIEKMEADIRKLNRKRDGGGGGESDEETKRKRAKRSYLQEEMAKYAKGRGVNKKGKRRDEGDVLAALSSFRGALQSSMVVDDDDDEVPVRGGGDGGGGGEGGQGEEGEAPASLGIEEDPGMEVDDDVGFLGHALHFPKDDGEESRKAERDYEVIDPRMRKAAAMEEERDRKNRSKASRGSWRGGRR